MAARDPKLRAHYGRKGAHESWARTPNREERTRAARRAFEARWERQVDPNGVMTPQDRAKAAANARAAYYLDLARKGVQARRAKRAA